MLSDSSWNLFGTRRVIMCGAFTGECDFDGFLLNATLIPAITGNFLGKRTKFLIFSDKFNHASINYGCLATRQKCKKSFVKNPYHDAASS